MPTYSIRRPLAVPERALLAAHSDLVAHLLFHRGVTSADAAAKFLSPGYESGTHDPFMLKDAEKAAARIIRAIEQDERIAVYADYDADGIPGAALMHDLFGRIGYANFSVYIPHRHDEGFGLNVEAIDQLASEGVRLIITVDCGISDALPVARANEQGIDVIITDHHEPPTALPAAYAIVDHRQADCPYPDKHLCGTGVAYKLAQAILKKAKALAASGQKSMIPADFKDGHEKWLLDLVGIATLSDMVPLTGENRVFAHYGLAVLRKSPRKGLVRLLAKLKIAQKHVSEDDIAFMITPRINAASRMGVPMDAFRLLAAATDAEADICAAHLDEINNERKGLVASLVKEVKKTVAERHGASSIAGLPMVIVLGNPSWRPSLLGLAANSCAEEFRRPVFLWGRDGGDTIKGSCRSEGASSVVEIMRAAPADVFTQFGGHHHSGGFAVANDQIHFLEQRLNEAAGKVQGARKKEQGGMSEGKEGSDISSETDSDMIDAELSMDDVSNRLYEDIAKLAPFGKGNPKPLFLFKNPALVSVRTFGKGNDHVELVFKKKNGDKVPAISFFGAENDWAKAIQPGKPMDLVASLEKSMFRGRAELRLRVADVILG